MEKQPTTITDSERALIARVNRKIKDDELLLLKKTRGATALADVGEFYIMNPYRNVLMFHHVNLEAYAKDCGALRPYEKLSS